MSQLLMIGTFLFVSVTGGQVEIQKMKNFPLGTWENGDQFLWKEAKVGDRMELATKVKADRKYRLQIVLTKAPDYGIVQFELDGKKVGGKIDVYSSWITNTPPIPLGDHQLTAGEHKLTVTIVGKNEKSKGTNVGIDRVLLKEVPVLPPVLPSINTSQLNELSKLELLPTLRPSERSIMFSSYDRTGGNNDGFSGAYSKLWGEDGGNVLAVMDGPGVIERIWFPYNCWKSGSMLRIYLDGNEKPAVEIPIEDLFSGKLPQFPKPIVGKAQGGYYCYVPIPYRDGCKVVLDDPKLKFYQVTYTKFPQKGDALIVRNTFSMDMDDQQKAALAKAVKVWSNLGDPASLELKNVKWTEVDLAIEPGKTQKIDLPTGAQMVRAIMLDGDKKQLDADRDAKIQLYWDGQKKPAVDVTTEFFFCQALAKKNIASLLTGANDQGWYNFMPMPYLESGTLVVQAADKPLTGKLRIATTSLPADHPKLGYFHVAYNENLPTKPNVYHPFLNRKGAGHYIGTYMVTSKTTKKKRKLPFWLEGDEFFTIDGSLDIHGTGSEDYFNCGWYAVKGRLNGPGGEALHGFPVYRLEDGHNILATAYRWHVADPVPYEKEIEAKIEHGSVNTTKANYRSSAFYYEVTP